MTDKDQGDPTQLGNLLDPAAGNIASVTADGANDGELVSRAVVDKVPVAEALIPPRCTGKPSGQANEAPTRRDRHLQTIAERGRIGWQRATDYGRRSLVETAMFRDQTLIGRSLRARSLPGQTVEVRMACAVLNRRTRLGMPISSRVACDHQKISAIAAAAPLSPISASRPEG